MHPWLPAAAKPSVIDEHNDRLRVIVDDRLTRQIGEERLIADECGNTVTEDLQGFSAIGSLGFDRLRKQACNEREPVSPGKVFTQRRKLPLCVYSLHHPTAVYGDSGV